MRLILHCALLVLYFAVTNSSLYTNLKNNVLQYFNQPLAHQSEILRASEDFNLGNGDADDTERGLEFQLQPKQIDEPNDLEEPYPKKYSKWQRELANVVTIKPLYHAKLSRPSEIAKGESEDSYHKRIQADLRDVEVAQDKIRILQRAKHIEDKLNNNNIKEIPMDKSDDVKNQRFHMDPVLNVLRNSNLRRARSSSDDSDRSSSSSRELKDWKEEWREHWTMKKFEALNSSAPRGDVVNMVGARPWGVPCGDPNQHDMPWGNCMLSSECESEYRIFRGDYFCGRTQFVCCAIQLTNYDLYQGFDVSFDDKSLSTDTEEKRIGGKGSSEQKKKNKEKEKKKRSDERKKRKKKIKQNIKKIIKEITKILHKAYRNGTQQRKRKTKMLKKFIKNLKRQFKKDRLSVKQIHGEQMIKIDAALQQKLNEISAVNQEFMRNETFREIVINGTITKKSARMLVEAFPELSQFLRFRRSGTRLFLEDPEEPVLEYDIEYGFLYY